MDSSSKPIDRQALHFVFIPFMQQGHMIPTIDIAILLAQRGATVTIISTPLNAARFGPIVSRAVASGLSIHVVEVQIPFQEAGLSEGCENQDMLDSLESSFIFFNAMSLLERPVEKIIDGLNPCPTCLFSDASITFTTRIAEKLRIPKIVFNGKGCFHLLLQFQLRISKVLESVKSESEYFVLPGLPDRVEFTKAQLSPPIEDTAELVGEFAKKIRENDSSSYGMVVNTFQELEPEYIKAYEKARGVKVWCIGPVSLCPKFGLDKAERGNKSSVDQENCLRWLDTQETGSVLYASFGSICNLPLVQLIELGLGLEATNRPFLWVIRGWEKYREIEKWISESGFEERVKGKGLLIRGWAPQVLILSHRSIGGFLTHCGWNSTLEGISAGVPLLTWPLFGDQFSNEKFVVQVLRIGVKMGVEKPMKWGKEEEIGLVVRREDVKRAVDELMDKGDEGEERRKRAKELAELAKKAVEEEGSSHHGITNLIEDIMKYSQK